VSGVQVEVNKGIRINERKREKFAKKLAIAIVRFVRKFSRN